MYRWIFRQLPGPLPVRIMIALLLLAAAGLLLVEWVFPWLSASGFLERGSTLGAPVPRSGL